MTKYILHGGMVKVECPSNDDFFRYMAEQLPEGGNWLGIYFAREEGEGRERFKLDQAELQKHLNGKKVDCILAEEESCVEQANAADVIFMTGGSADKLKEGLTRKPGIIEAFRQNKIVAGSSAGAMVLCSKSVNEHGEIFTGLGILPQSLGVHYCSQQERFQKIQEVSALPKPILLVPETQFIVIET